MAELQQRFQEVQRVNNLFFQVLNRSTSAEAVYEALATLSLTEESLLYYLGSSNRLETIRETDDPPSEKIVAFLAALREDAGLGLANQESVKGCLEALKAWEGAGKVNALLVKSNSESALVIPLQIKVQTGDGRVYLVVDGCEDFKATLERVRVALLGQRFLRDSDDVVCTLKLTESNYRHIYWSGSCYRHVWGGPRDSHRSLYGLHWRHQHGPRAVASAESQRSTAEA